MHTITLRPFQIPRSTAQQRGHGANGRTWRSPGLKLAVATWQAALEPYAPKTPIGGPVRLNLCLHYHRKGVKPYWKTTRPDLDNAVKVVVDVMTRLGFWKDDSQVCYVVMTKHVVPWGEGAVIEYDAL